MSRRFRLFGRSLSCLALAVGLVAGAASFVGAPQVAAAEVPQVRKIAMVNMQDVLNKTKAGKAARKNLERSSKAKQQKLDKKRSKLEAEAGKLRSLSGESLARAQEKLQKESYELQSALETARMDLANQEAQLLEKMYRNSQKIVAKMARESKFDLVLVRDEMTVIYAKDAYDITDEVVKRYNKAHAK